MSYDAPPPPPSQPPSQPPYGQPNPYGQAPSYGQGGYGQPGHGQPGGQTAYAHWGKRVGAFFIDAILMSLAYLPALVGIVMIVASAETTTTNGTTTVDGGEVSGVAVVLIVLGVVAYLAFAIWNIFIKQGRTGYTIGKGVLGIKLIGEQTGQPIGAGKAFLRQICHVLDSFCYIGYLWPLWDAKKQTFADKIMTTIVVDQPKG